MSFTSWLQYRRNGMSPRHGRRQSRRNGSRPTGVYRPRFETLEERLALSFIWAGSPSSTPAEVEWAPHPPLLADFTSDSILDRISGGWGVTVEPGLGDGTFAEPIHSEVGTAHALAVADFNGDGGLDLVATDSNSLGDGAYGSVSLGRGDGSFYPVQSFDLFNRMPERIGTGDFDGDGQTDIAIAGWDLYGDGGEVIEVLINDGNWPSLPLSLRIGNATVAEGNTGTVSGKFTVTLSAASTQPITVAYSTGNGTATAGSDYTATGGILAFAPGETSKTITVPVKGDRLGEPNETFVVNLSSPVGATIADGQGAGKIVDDEPRISISDVTKAEGKNGKTTLFTFTVTLSASYDQPVKMSFRTVDGTGKTSDNDYVAKSGTLTFAPGETTKTISIEVKGDSKKEANETFYLDLFGLSSNALFTKNRGIGTILNDD